MDFLRLHLPGLHQALRGTLDSFSTFVSYLLGDEVPTVERREARAAEELGEVTAGRPGRTVEEEAQEALEVVGGSQSKGAGGLRGPGEARIHQEGRSALEQTWSWGEGSSHGSQGDRQDTGAWEAAKASRCQEPSAPLEARKKPEAASEAGGDGSGQAQESQECNEQEVNRDGTLRTWEQEEEEVRARKPGVASGVESERTRPREPEGKASAEGQEVAGDGGQPEQAVKEAAAEEIQEPGAKEAGREEEVVAMVTDSQSTRAQGTQEPGRESEDGATLGRGEAWTTSGGEEAWTTSGRVETETTSGGQEAWTTSGREEAWTTSGGEEAWTTSGGEEAWTTSGREEIETTSDGEEARTTSGREEAWTTSSREEIETTSDGEEARTTSGGEEARTTSGREEAWTTSGRVETQTTSGGQEAWTTSGGQEAWTTSSREEIETTSDGEEAWTTSGGEEVWTTSGREEIETTSDGEEARTTSGGEEAWTTSGREEAWTTSGREEAWTTSGREEIETTSDGEEARRTSGGEEAWTTSGREEAWTTSGREEAWTTPGREETETTSDGEEASSMEVADLPAVRETEYGAVPGDRIAWVLEEASKEAQEEEVGENREAEVSLFLQQTQALGTEGMGEAAKDQTAGKEAAEGQESEWEASEGFEGQADQDGKEAKGRQDSEIRAAQASLEEVVQAQEAKEEKESCQAIETELSWDKVANEAESDADFEETPEARPEEEFREMRHEEEAQMGQEELGVECGGPEHTEVQEPELIGGFQTPVEQPEEGLGGKGELWSILALSKEETERSLADDPRHTGYVKPGAEAWENQRKRDVESGDTPQGKVGAEEGEGEGEAAGVPESAPGQALEAGGEWKEAKEAGCGAETQEPRGGRGAEVRAGQSLGESDARETKDEQGQAEVPWEADETPRRDWRLTEAAPSFQDSEDAPASPSASGIAGHKAASDERAAATGEGPEREAGEVWDGIFGRGWDSEGREEAGRGEELMEAAEGENRGGQRFGLEGSEGEEATGGGGQAEAFEATEGEPGGEWVEVGDSRVAEGGCGMDGFTSGSQAVRAEGTLAIVEAEGLPEGQMLLEKEAGVWQAIQQGQGSDRQCGDLSPEGEVQVPCDMEDAEVTRHQRAEAEDTAAEDLEVVQGTEEQPTNQEPAEVEPGPREEAAGSARGDAHGSWSEALLPVSRLDVSVPRSRVLLSRSSSQRRRSRPSFRRIPTPEQQEPASPPPEEELSAPEQRLLQPEEPPEPSLPRPEGTPVPARRPLGHGFGLAHSGMMQELQARLGRPKPQ